MWNIYWPMNEVRKKFNIDSDRIFLDGVGEGGEIALHLAALRAKDFAGVAVRNAKPIAFDVLPNLGSLVARFHLRKTGVLTTAEDQNLRKAILDLAKKHGLDIEMKEHEPLDRKAAARAKRFGDPIIEATAMILEGFSGVRRNPYPNKVHFLTTDLMFNRSHWFKLTPTEFDRENSIFPVVEAEIDRKKNEITITQSNVDSLYLYLNDQLIDMDRVVKVVINGKTLIEERGDRSLDVMLKYRKGNLLDSGVVVTRQIDVRIPEPDSDLSWGPDTHVRPSSADLPTSVSQEQASRLLKAIALAGLAMVLAVLAFLWTYMQIPTDQRASWEQMKGMLLLLSMCAMGVSATVSWLAYVRLPVVVAMVVAAVMITLIIGRQAIRSSLVRNKDDQEAA
jgi:hypothetical protein